MIECDHALAHKKPVYHLQKIGNIDKTIISTTHWKPPSTAVFNILLSAPVTITKGK